MNASFNHPVLIVVVPLLFAALCPIIGLIRRSLVVWLALFGTACTSFLALSLIGRVTPGNDLSYHLGGWEPPWGIEIRIDTFGLLMVCVISTLGILLVLYSWKYMERELPANRLSYYYTLLMLIYTAMLGFSITGDIFNMFVFMEIFAITSYALVAVTGEKRALRAAFKYLLMGATSSVCVLLAITFLYSVTGSLNMLDISNTLAELSPDYIRVALAALVFFITGFSVKAALFPVHVWLPEAHSIAPSPVSALLSALVIKMGVFGIFRILFTVYGPGFANETANWKSLNEVVAWAAALSILAGAAFAIAQKDLKLMIAYSSISHIGYIVLGICLLSYHGTAGGFYNVLAHAMGKASFFLVAGCFLYKKGFRRIEDLKGLGRSMPISSGAFALASLSVIGLPPSAGFIAKWNILWGCLDSRKYLFAGVVLLGSVLAAVYCLKVVYYLFFTGPRMRDTRIEEAPAAMYVPAALLSLGTLFFGIFSGLILPSLNSASRILMIR
ncbi:MAG: monovalent cation/H+ antiporter subunit D family protein [Actinobacteria bacterium]|nr:monovalent cation/H+ antiporter subunit D family protein [Actinomycetota bacterium]